MAGTVVARPFEQTDEEQHLLLTLGAEPEVLVVLHALLGVEVDVEQLAVPQRLGDPVVEVQVGHLLMTDLGVESHHVGSLELVDEGEGVPDGGQKDVAPGLVRLRLEREAQVVALLHHVLAQEVEGLLVAIEGDAYVLGRVGVGALPTAPAHERLGSELGGDVEVGHHLADGVTTHHPVVGGERTLPEHRVVEEVGRGHRAHDARLVERRLEPVDAPPPLTVALAWTEQIVVVERHAPHAELAHLLHEIDRIGPATGRVAERVTALMADGPEAEREPVLVRRAVRAHGRSYGCG